MSDKKQILNVRCNLVKQGNAIFFCSYTVKQNSRTSDKEICGMFIAKQILVFSENLAFPRQL